MISSFPVRSFRFRRAGAAMLALGLGAFYLASSVGAARAQSFTILHTFDNSSEGLNPLAPLTQGADGLLYGTLRENGVNNMGAAYRTNLNGKNFGVLTAFGGTNNGLFPESGLLQARDGNFYGTTFSGGANGYGSLYQLTTGGQQTLLTSFNNGNPGSNPTGSLLLGLDGAIYGSAEFGGTSNFGTIFRATVPDGTTAVLSTFGGSTDGSYPTGTLIQATDGNFYGTTSRGGPLECGTIFRLTPAGQRTVLYTFTGNADGYEPLRGVIQGTDGNFYGIARQGGTGAGGVFYRITPNAVFTVLYSFFPLGNGLYNSYGELIQASDGNFYGTAYQGGLYGNGGVFRLTSSGAYTELYDFTGGSDGGFPRAGLFQASDGNLYGTTAGINGQQGTLFRVDLNLPTPTPKATLLQTSASVGDTIAIAGDNFVGASAVSFAGSNGGTVAAASFTVYSKYYLEAIVPDGVATGTITVSANGQTGTSTNTLTVGSIVTTPAPQIVTVVAQDPVASEAGANRALLNHALRRHRAGVDGSVCHRQEKHGHAGSGLHAANPKADPADDHTFRDDSRRKGERERQSDSRGRRRKGIRRDGDFQHQAGRGL